MQVTIEPVRLDVLVSDVARLMAVRAENQGLALHTEFDGKLPRVIETDPLRLRQILLSLVGNAIKFTHDGSIRIVTRHLPSGDASCQIQFDIIDTGIGISEAQVAKLFQPFVQGDASQARNYGGTGLGLTISRRLAQAMGVIFA